MSDNVLLEMAKQVPAALALILTVYLFLNHIQKNDDKRFAHEKELETQRAANAKMHGEEQRAHELAMNNMWANHIKTIVDQVSAGNSAIAKALEEHEKASRDRYEKMGITDDLLQMAKEKLK